MCGSRPTQLAVRPPRLEGGHRQQGRPLPVTRSSIRLTSRNACRALRTQRSKVQILLRYVGRPGPTGPGLRSGLGSLTCFTPLRLPVLRSNFRGLCPDHYPSRPCPPAGRHPVRSLVARFLRTRNDALRSLPPAPTCRVVCLDLSWTMLWQLLTAVSVPPLASRCAGVTARVAGCRAAVRRRSGWPGTGLLRRPATRVVPFAFCSGLLGRNRGAWRRGRRSGVPGWLGWLCRRGCCLERLMMVS